MRKLLFILFFVTVLGCNSNDDGNTILPNILINPPIELNLDLASNQDLLFPGGFVYIPGGISGIIVYNLNNNQYFAYDRACPHKQVGECQPMIVIDGLSMECPCDGSRFALALEGQPQSDTPFAARQYRAIRNGNTLTITNF